MHHYLEIVVVKKFITLLVRLYDIRKNNEILFRKIFDTSLNNKPSKQFFNYRFAKPRKIGGQKKFEMIKIAQENQKFSKRLIEGKSFYSAKKLENDYAKNMYYKQKICLFPSISFNQSKLCSSRSCKEFNYSMKNPYFDKITFNNTNDTTSSNEISPLKRITTYIDNLGDCRVELGLEKFR